MANKNLDGKQAMVFLKVRAINVHQSVRKGKSMINDYDVKINSVESLSVKFRLFTKIHEVLMITEFIT